MGKFKYQHTVSFFFFKEGSTDYRTDGKQVWQWFAKYDWENIDPEEDEEYLIKFQKAWKKWKEESNGTS